MKWKSAILQGLIMASIIALVAVPALAQPHNFGPPDRLNPEQRIDRRVGFLNEKLNLTKDQDEQIRDILENAQAEAAEWQKDHPEASREDRRVFREEHRATTHAAISKVLTEDQNAVFESLKETRDQRWGHGRHGMGGGMWDGHGMHNMQGRHHMRGQSEGPGSEHGGMLQGFLRRLDLSEQQRDDLAALRDDRKAEMAAWQKEHADATWQDRLAFRSSQLNASIGAIASILTPEQNEKLDELLAQPRPHRFGHFDRMKGPGMFLRRLNLSDQQQEQLRKLREDHQAAATKWHEANPNATREDRRAFREEQRKDMQEGLTKVLTEEQLKKLKSLRAGHRWNQDFGPPPEDTENQ